MASSSSAGRAFSALLVLATASLALLIGLLWWQVPHLAQGVWLACQSAAQAVEGYLPLVGLLLPLALLVMGVLRGLCRLASQLWYTRLLVRDLDQRSLPMPDGLANHTDSLHLGGLVTVVDDVEAYAFAAGLARPRIWLSSGLLALLDEAELAAVLRHERHHLVQRDPLRVLVARSLVNGLFFMPVASVLLDRYMEAKEREADAASGASYDLAAALLKLMRAGSPLPPSASLAAAGSAPTARRIRRLLGGEPDARSVDRALLQRLFVSLALATALWTASTVSLSQAASPLTGGECGYTTTELYSTPANFTPHSMAPWP